MFRLNHLLMWLLAAVQFIFASDPVITVTNQNMAFIRETRALEIKRGIHTYTIENLPAAIDPATCLFTGKARDFNVLTKVFRYDLSDLDRVLYRALQSDITAISDQQTTRGRLLAFDGRTLFVETSDGLLYTIKRSETLRIIFEDPGRKYTATPTLLLQAEAPAAGNDEIHITYLTREMDWEAVYSAMYSERDASLELSAEVAVSNRSGKSFRQAKLRLMAGDLHEAPSRGGRMQKMMEFSAASSTPDEAGSVAEYKLYDMPGLADLPDRETCYIRFMEPIRFRVDRRYEFNPRIDPEGIRVGLVSGTDQAPGPGIPLPAGTVRIYNADDQTEYIGSDRLPHTAEGEQISLTIGKAFDLKAERKVLEQKRLSGKSEQMSVQVELSNRKEEAVEITVTEPIPAYRSYEVVRSSHPVEMKDARQVNFRLPVPAKERVTLTYTILFTW